MANEEYPKSEVKITDSSKLCDMSRFYLNDTFSDLKIILSNQEIPAHKNVLAVRCKFFENILMKNPKQSELTFQNVDPKAFLKVLEYIYTGSVTLISSEEDLPFEVLKLAQEYSLESLKEGISEKLKTLLDMTNVCQLLNKANDYDMEELRTNCLNIINDHVEEALSRSDFFNSFTQKSMVSILQSDLFPVPEIDVFNIVEKWCKIHHDVDGLVVQCIRLSLLTMNEILDTVWPSKLINNEILLTVLAALREGSAKGPKPERILRINNYYRGTESVKNASHTIGANHGIVVDLGETLEFNHINMKLEDTANSYRYYIETFSKRTWNKLIDYTHCNCRCEQNLYFEKQKARFIKVVGTFATSGNDFRLAHFEVSLKSDVPEVIGGIVRPKTNVTTPDMGAIVIVGEIPQALLNGKLNERTWHRIGEGQIVIQLGQPYLISNMRLLLEYFLCRYFIETSLDNVNWEMAVDRRNQDCSSWQNLKFTERPAVFIRIKGTASLYECFNCYHFECPNKN